MKTVLLLSGGLDSAALLYRLRADGHEVLPLSVDYGQRHHRELQAARSLAGGLRLSLAVVHAPHLAPLLAASALTDPGVELPRGLPADDPAQAATVVPGRNLILIALAAGYAVARDADAVAFAANASDAEIYPDCRTAFIDPLRAAVAACRPSRPLWLQAPFVRMTKAAVVAEGVRLGVPFGLTWSCYSGGERPCGACGACDARAAAFARAGATDPGAA